MPYLTLKSYQQAALSTLQTFARAAQLKGPALAFGEHVGRPYNPDLFGAGPCICLRIPTGGGQTFNALQTNGHPSCEAIEASYGAGVRVCVLKDLNKIAAYDCGERAVVVIASIQSFRIDDTDKRTAGAKYKGAHLLNDPYETEKRQIGELWARKSAGKCLFGQIVKDRAGVGMSSQLDALLA